MKKSVNGFTIVELLIVIVVVAILAAIIIVAYNGIRERANDSAVQSDLHGAVTKMHEYQATNGVFPTTSTSQLTATGLKFTRSSYYIGGNNIYFCRDNTSDNYAFVAQSLSGNRYMVSSSNPTVRTYGAGSWNAAAICPAAGIADYAATGAYLSSAWQSWAGQ